MSRKSVSGRIAQTRGAALGRAASTRITLKNLLYALTGFTSSNVYATQSGGGEAGIATGFGIWSAFVPLATSFSAAQMLTGRSGGSTVSGWQLYASASGAVTGATSNAAGTSYFSTPTYQLTASDVGKILIALLYVDGAKTRLWVSRRQQADGTAIDGFLSSALPQYLGILVSLFLATGCRVLATSAFRGTAPDSAILDYFDRGRALGDLPDSMQGVSLTHHWSAKRAFQASFPLNAPAAPATLADNITGATADKMTASGSPTFITIDPTADGSKTYGVHGFDASNYYATAAGAGIRGSAAGFWVAAYLIFDAIPSATFQQPCSCSNSGASSGWYFSAVSATIKAALYSAGNVLSSSYTIVASDVNQPKLFLLHYTGAALRLYVNRVQVGSDVAGSGLTLTLSSIEMRVGSPLYAGQPFSGGRVLGLSGGVANPTLAEIQTLFDQTDIAGAIQGIPGKTDHLWDITGDVIASGAETVPTTVLDRVGTDNLTLVGSACALTQRAKRSWSYEASPIYYGAKGFTAANYYSVVGGGFPGSSSGFWICWVGTIDSQSVSSATRYLLDKTDSAGFPGWHLKTDGLNSSIQFTVGSTTGQTTPGSSAIASTEVGKIFVVICSFDGTKAHMYLRRVELGSGSAALTGTYTASSNDLMMGRFGAGSPADGVSCLGWSAGNGVITLADAQALHDAIVAKEKIQGVPGKTDVLIDLTLDVGSSGALPATLQDRAGSANMTRQGSPTLASQYARVYPW